MIEALQAFQEPAFFQLGALLWFKLFKPIQDHGDVLIHVINFRCQISNIVRQG